MDNKLTYRIRNWSEYNRALIQRGSLTIWFEEAAPKWHEKKSSKRGRPKTYSDDAILCALILRAVYHLPLRQLRGFLLWIFHVMYLNLPVPCYTRICRRAASIGQDLKRLTAQQPRDVVFDSTGIKVYGEGEWKVRQHGKGKRRTWRKIHLAVCPNSHEIILSKLTESACTDAKAAKQMIKKLPKRTKTAYGDGAYDQEPFYKGLNKQRIKGIVPPRRKGRLCDTSKKPWMQDRNDALRAITGLGNDDEARKLWKILAGYHTRSLGETAMSRFKRIFAKLTALNKMTSLGMPQGKWLVS